MKKLSHIITCIAWIIFGLTSCEKQKDIDQAKKTASSESDVIPNSDSAATTKPPLAAIEFDDPADVYFQAYLLIRESEKTSDQEESIRILKDALGYFKAVESQFPDWKTSMVDARIKDTEQKLESLAMNGR